MTKANPYNPKTQARAKAKALARSITLRRQRQALAVAILRHWQVTLAPALGLSPWAMLHLGTGSTRSWLDAKLKAKSGIILTLPPLLLIIPGHPQACLWISPLTGLTPPSARAMARHLTSLGHGHSFAHSVSQAEASIRHWLTFQPQA